jgi:hypothetical protein
VLLALAPVRVTALRGSRSAKTRLPLEDEDEQIVRLILKEHARMTAGARRQDSAAK